MAHEASRMLQAAPETAQEIPKTLLDGTPEAKIVEKTMVFLCFLGLVVLEPLRLQESPRWPQDGPRWPQDGAKTSQDGTNTAPRVPQGGSRWLKMAQEEPKRAPRGIQQGPQEGSKRDLGTNLAQRALLEAPGTLPAPSGERFWD